MLGQTVHSVIALYLNVVDLMRLHLIGIRFDAAAISQIGRARLGLDVEMDTSEWNKSYEQIQAISDEREQQRARCLRKTPMAVYSDAEFRIEHDSKFQALPKPLPFLSPMPRLWSCNVWHASCDFASAEAWDVALLHDVVLCRKLQRRVQYHLSEWMFGNESAYALQSGVVAGGDKAVDKLLDDADAKEIARRLGSTNWASARLYRQYQDELRDELVCPEKPPFVDADPGPEQEAELHEFARLFAELGWKAESFKDFMLKDHAESNDGEFCGSEGFDEEMEYGDPSEWYSALFAGERVFEMLYDRCVIELGDQSEPAPMLFAARSPTGNLICVLTATGWSCG